MSYYAFEEGEKKVDKIIGVGSGRSTVFDVNQYRKIVPGQLWVFGDGIETGCVVCSQEPDEPWVCMCFGAWKYGGYTREFSESEIRRMKYVGCLAQLGGGLFLRGDAGTTAKEDLEPIDALVMRDNPHAKINELIQRVNCLAEKQKVLGRLFIKEYEKDMEPAYPCNVSDE